MQLSLSRSAVVARPVVVPTQRPRMMLVRSSGPHPSLKDVADINKEVEKAIQTAEDTCKGGDAAHCAAAWDNVEELSAAAAHKKVAYQDDKVASDPLEAFCDDNPDADECRVYED